MSFKTFVTCWGNPLKGSYSEPVSWQDLFWRVTILMVWVLLFAHSCQANSTHRQMYSSVYSRKQQMQPKAQRKEYLGHTLLNEYILIHACLWRDWFYSVGSTVALWNSNHFFFFARCKRRQVSKFGQLPEVTIFGCQTNTKTFWFAFKTLLKPYSVLFERHTLESRI